MNIKAIRLTNFRWFRDARIELKPLTVLLGPNSAGKSSFGQALAAMAHVHRSNRSTPQASLTPPKTREKENWPVDLGLTDDLRMVGTEGPVRIGLETSGGLVELGFGGLPDSQKLLLSYVLHPSGEQSTVAGINPDNAIAMVSQVPPSEVVPIKGEVKEISSAIELQRRNVNQWQDGASAASVTLDGLIVLAVQHTTSPPLVLGSDVSVELPGAQVVPAVENRTFISRTLSGVASTDLRSLLEQLTYLRANRKRASRGYEHDFHDQQKIGYSGEFAPSVLLDRGTEPVTLLLPPPIPNTVEEAQKCDFAWEERQAPLLEALGVWLSQIELAHSIEAVPPTLEERNVLLRVDKNRDITEVGFGVSQVVPILVAGLLQPKDSLFIVDLPEAHLHPRPQAAIADFFCAMALSGRSVLVETHSEMFFHRLRLRAAMDPKLMEKIAVYSIDQPTGEGCARPRSMGLRFEDELRWPEGFLHEAWEMEMQIKAVREANRIRANDSASA